jgi:UDP-3-O-[3-hydroxymyristoyl] N-acetylglucosamine deacetylase
VRARTFGFKRDLETLRARGLARGGSLGNAVLIDEGGILNPEGLRFADEFVRHKALDCLGDLSLAGAPIIGHFHGHKPGHALNNALLAALFTQQKSWSYVPLGEYHQLWTDEVHTRGPSLTRVADSVDRRT